MPTYRQMGDHTEVVKVFFDADKIGYETLLKEFWSMHSGRLHGYGGTQYQSIVAAQTDDQYEFAERVKRGIIASEDRMIETVIKKANDYTPAENHHQKYFLRHKSRSWHDLTAFYGDENSFLLSPLATKLNGLAGGYLTKAELICMIKDDELFKKEREKLLSLVTGLKW